MQSNNSSNINLTAVSNLQVMLVAYNEHTQSVNANFNTMLEYLNHDTAGVIDLSDADALDDIAQNLTQAQQVVVIVRNLDGYYDAKFVNVSNNTVTEQGSTVSWNLQKFINYTVAQAQ